MKLIPQAFYDAGMRRQHPIAMEPESQAPLSALAWDTINWGEGWQYTMPPKIDTKKYLSLGKHQTNICDRWQQNKATMAGTAWLSGIGMESWENDWVRNASPASFARTRT